MLLYVEKSSVRLQYILQVIGPMVTNTSWTITTDKEMYKTAAMPGINYSDTPIRDKEIRVSPHGLLLESTIKEQEIVVENRGEMPIFFANVNSDTGFDIFAAAFYLITRYEEYLPHKKDAYGRYAHQNSVAYTGNFLRKPVVNQWAVFLQEKIIALYNTTYTLPDFVFIPSYDIDIAYSYRHKGFIRNAGGCVKDLLKGKWSLVKERVSVLMGKQKDPYDSFGWLNRLHEETGHKPYYFFMTAVKNGPYDKHILPHKQAAQQLIHNHIIRYPVGLHPSWQSGDKEELIMQEKEKLEQISGQQILSSRQHFIRFTLPHGFQQLLAAGIQFDFSMGYGSVNGFRASICTPYYWYDLSKEEATNLLLFPFCFMDANALNEEKLSPVEALEEMRYFFQQVKAVNGYYIMVWHNHYLGTSDFFKDWKNGYEQFLREVGNVDSHK